MKGPLMGEHYWKPRDARKIVVSAGLCAALFGLPSVAYAADAGVMPTAVEQTQVAATDAATADKAVSTTPVADEGKAGANTGEADSTTTGDATDKTDTAAGDATDKTDASTGDTATTDKAGTTGTTTGDTTGKTDSAATTGGTGKTDPAATTQGATTPEHSTVDEGTYVIEGGTNVTQVLDVANGKKTNGTNVQTFTSNMTNAQKWTIKADGDTGYYTIGLYGTNKVLDVRNGKSDNGTNVQVYEKNGSDAQRWLFVRDEKSGYYKLVSALAGDKVLDVAGGGKGDGTNVQIYAGNGTSSQLFNLILVIDSTGKTVVAAPGAQIAAGDGSYAVVSGKNSGYSLDVVGGSTNNGTNVQIYQGNQSNAQRYYFKYDGKGYYTIGVTGTGKVLDAAYGNVVPTTNVWQYISNGSDAQKWAAVYNSADGTYSFVNKATSLYLDISGGKVVNGSNVQLYFGNGTAAQRFKLSATNAYKDDIYSIHSFTNSGKALDVTGGSSNSGTGIQLYTYDGVLAQKYQLQSIAGTSNEYRIRTAASGGWLTVSNAAAGTRVTQVGKGSDTATAANTWVAVWNGTYLSFMNKLSGLVMEVAGNDMANGTKISTYEMNGTDAQHFYMTADQLINNGCYIIKSKLGTVVDVSGGSFDNGANIQAWGDNGTNSQKFFITWTSGGYVITNVQSDKSLDVTNWSKADGANVQQYDTNGSTAQGWKAAIVDGGYLVLANVNSGKMLEIAGGNRSAGANIQQYKENDTDAQEWKMILTQIYGWIVRPNSYTFYYHDGSSTGFSSASYGAWNRISTWGSNSNYLICIDQDACRTLVFSGSANHWEPKFDWLTGVGSPSLGLTFTGTSTIFDKYYTMDAGPKEYFACKFYDNGLDPMGYGQCFHSVLYWDELYGPVYDGSLGVRVSHGCCRLATENARWMYYNIPLGTLVYSYRFT
ncbi:MAG: RICIN domain-containing protein [Atopobiaceae bacterium]|nr:RICIN domain-containing protein [Atopobiaceae bacterium]MCI2207627.1 RICIN domain-containing protein [Atopobiaceae bacterium]